LDFQINLTFEFVMTVVGIMTFVSIISIFEQFNSITMQNVKTLIMQILMGLFISVSCGVTLVERMAFQTPNYNVIKSKEEINLPRLKVKEGSNPLLARASSSCTS
jgi:hypothetical protein